MFRDHPRRTVAGAVACIAVVAGVFTTTLSGDLGGPRGDTAESAATGAGDDRSAKQPDGSVDLDPALDDDRTAPAIPGRDAERATTVVHSPGDVRSRFVSDEAILLTEDDAPPDALLDRLDAEVVRSTELGNTTQHLLTIGDDAPGGERSSGSGSSDAADPTSVGDERGLATIAAVEDAGAEGYDIGLNWLVDGHGYDEGSTREGSGPQGSKSHRWSHFDTGQKPRTGVTDAWQLMARRGVLDADPPTVRVAVIDGGFTRNADLPEVAGELSLTADPVFGTENPMRCTGGSRCPWHGTQALAAATAEPDDEYGTAGTAGPVAEAMPILIDGSWFQIAESIVTAAAADAEVISLSLGGNAPGWVADVLGRAVLAARDEGSLVLASAGNDDRELRAASMQEPCGVTGVLCIGALGHRSEGPAGYSNHGRVVDLWAPGKVRGTSDPDKSRAHWYRGTSAAAPFAAGAAALVQSVTEDNLETEAILVDTAREGNGAATAYVDADAALQEALGPGTDFVARGVDDGSEPFEVDIADPVGGETFESGERLDLWADHNARGDDEPVSVRWEIDRATLESSASSEVTAHPEGGLEHTRLHERSTDIARVYEGEGAFLTSSRLWHPGNYVVRAVATTAHGETDDDRVTVTVAEGDAPRVTITSHDDGGRVAAGRRFVLHGTSFHPFRAPGFTDDQLSWFVDGRRVGTGRSHTINVTLAAGEHRIVLVGEDDLWTVQHEVSLDAVPVTSRTPDVIITEPTESPHHVLTDGSDDDGAFATVRFEASAFADDGASLDEDELVWTAEWEDCTGTKRSERLGTGDELEARLHHLACGGAENATPYRIRLRAEDASEPDALPVVDELTVSVGTLY